jgi:ribosome maturation factor RimP
MMISQTERQLWVLLQPVVEGLGYEFAGLEYLSQGRRSLLRIYIDSPEGVTLEDCEQVSFQVSGVLDVEEPLKGAYVLEVSSPGFDRPLFTTEQFQRFCGQKVSVRLSAPHEGRRKVAGVLAAADELTVRVIEDGREFVLPFDLIEKARLIPEDVTVGKGGRGSAAH